MKKMISFLFLLLGTFSINELAAQTQVPTEKDRLQKPYHPEADAQRDIDSLINKAGLENKHIILQAGGNWCIWCLRFNEFIHTNEAVKNVLAANFLYYHLNYSPENKNVEVFKKYAPEGSKLGYPFFIVLDKKGNVVAIQESGSLESGKGYDEEKVLKFFNSWK